MTSSPSRSVTFPTASQENAKRKIRSTAEQDSGVLSLFRDMKNEMRTDLAAINFKIDDINSVKSFKIRK
jgi:hypothetical protein